MEKISINSITASMTHVVECKWPQNSFYEPIAAFNCEGAAQQYMKECVVRSNSFKYNFSYRICEVLKP